MTRIRKPADAVSPSTDAVRRQMQRQVTSGTRPELRLRSELHKRGLRFRLNVCVGATGPGKIDIAFVSAKVAVFVDGCFWHGCTIHKSVPVANQDFWQRKIQATRERDERMTRRLQEEGWVVVRVWEHDNPVDAASRIVPLVRARANPRRPPQDG